MRAHHKAVVGWINLSDFWSCDVPISLKLIRSYFKRADPFYDEQENHSLIGVANVFLESLFYDVKLQYAVPIVNQKGEVSFLFIPCTLQRKV